ncbi:histone PARylation factor 1-like [Argiope bruennichi]|uniref:Histone PARylation factor 1 like protein n=1 Tax=Argiope bruennichi TaxID=94029 RepID=A0A8T0EAI6_ARGBR|nr:histone PARylation factor 1-like [Argiope bruennichi]KAF8767215.1 Histone PARylation factor 1 like protein [Argiope bruennichi]
MDSVNRKRKSKDMPMCKYGLSCYQKNPEHHKKYRHPESVVEPKNVSNQDVVDGSSISDEEPPSKTSRISDKAKIELSDDEEEAPKTSLAEPKFKETVEKVLKSMPQDFFDFWDFCASINKQKPEDAFADFDLYLIGIYDLLVKKLPPNKEILLHCHYRYYYDPPELQTVIKSNDKSLFHIGYFRDDPESFPSVLVSNNAAVDCKLTLKGDNIFAAMNAEITDRIKKMKPKSKKQFIKIQENLQKFAKEKKYSLEISTSKTTSRNKKVVSKTFNSFGIVVPVKNDVGYRPLPDSNAKIKSILQKIVNAENEEKRLTFEEDLDELITNVQFANDECDFGMGLELGIDLFCFGDPYFHSHILSILPLAYNLLNRPKYAEVVQFHLANRKKSHNLNTLD